MKSKKLTAVITAAMTMIAPLSSSIPALTPVTVFAEDTAAAAEFPDWVPTDFDSAVNFRNNYGATHIEDGYVCIVYQRQYEKVDPEDLIQFERYQLMTTGNALRCEAAECYTYPDDSVKIDTEYCVMLLSAEVSGEYEVDLIDTALTASPDTEHPESLGHYSFSVDQYGNITETDIYSWLPDSSVEYDDYVRDNGEVSAHDNYVVFCTMTIEQLGDKWEPDSSNRYENIKYLLTSDCTMEVRELYCDGSVDKIYVYQALNDGYEKVSWVRTSTVRPDPQERKEYTLTADCVILDNAQTVLLPGSVRGVMKDSVTGEPLEYQLPPDSEYGIWLFRECDLGGGYVENPAITGIRSNPFIINYKDISEDREYGFHIENVDKVFKVHISLPEETVVTKYDNNSFDIEFKLKKTVSGDVNSDGQFSIADLVVFEKWLLGASDAELADWKAADLYNDGSLDTFDLCRMRQLLAENSPELKNAPAIRDDYGKVTDEQRIALTEALSKQYPGFDLSDFTFEYSPDHPLSSHFAGPCFYVYYKGILAHGYGDLSLNDNVFAAFDYKGNPSIELLIDPRKYSEIDLAPENMLTEEEAYDRDCYPDHDISRIIYFDMDDSSSRLNQYAPKLAYMLKDRNQTYEMIIDAVTGEEIDLIPYYVPVV